MRSWERRRIRPGTVLSAGRMSVDNLAVPSNITRTVLFASRLYEPVVRDQHSRGKGRRGTAGAGPAF